MSIRSSSLNDEISPLEGTVRPFGSFIQWQQIGANPTGLRTPKADMNVVQGTKAFDVDNLEMQETRGNP